MRRSNGERHDGAINKFRSGRWETSGQERSRRWLWSRREIAETNRELLSALGAGSPFGGFHAFAGGLDRGLDSAGKGGVFTGDAPFGIALDQPGNVSGKGLAKPTFVCDLLTRFVNRVL